MLTITETIDAINVIDTDKDIILGACRKIVFGDPNPSTSTEEIAQDIIRTFSSKVSPANLIIALTKALGAAAAIATKPGQKFEMLEAILAATTGAYLEHQTSIFGQKLEKTPERTLNKLFNMLKNLK